MSEPQTPKPSSPSNSNSQAASDAVDNSKQPDDPQVQIIDWDGPDDSANPYNWSSSRKWTVASVALIGSLILPWNGTSITVAAHEINAAFGVSDATFPNSYWAVTSWSLGGTVFVLLALPLMEDFGVRAGFLAFYTFFVLMIIPQALAQNFATLVVTRFLSGGCVGLLANTAASMIPDLWTDETTRSIPVSIYIYFYVAGSTLGPPLFAGVMQHIGNWRWIFYIQLIIYASFLPIFIIFLRETRSNVILRSRARQIRKHTSNTVRTRTDFTTTEPLLSRLRTSIARPIFLLFTEPVLFAVTLWSAFSFGTVYLFTQSVELVFVQLYSWKTFSTGYVQFAVVIGETVGFIACLYQRTLFLRSASRNTENPGSPIPEARLYVSVAGSFIGMTGGMFVYAWTSYPTIPWIAPAVGLAMVGFGLQTNVNAGADYITDAYAASGFAGSAISAVVAVENITAGFLPLATMRMYQNIGLRWASSLIAFLALMLSFAPVLFIWKGRWFRARSPFMQAGDQIGDELSETADIGHKENDTAV